MSWKFLNFGGVAPNALDEKSVAGTESADILVNEGEIIVVKTEYSANNVTAELKVVLKDFNDDVGRLYSTKFTPVNTAENDDIQETGFFHGETKAFPAYRAKSFRIVLVSAPTNSGTVSVWATTISSNDQAAYSLLSGVKLTDGTNDFPNPVRRDMEGGGKIAVGTTAVEATFTGIPTSIIITADVFNTGLLYIGKSNVASNGNNALTFLEAGESVTIEYDDSSNAVYVVASIANQNFIKGALL